MTGSCVLVVGSEHAVGLEYDPERNIPFKGHSEAGRETCSVPDDSPVATLDEVLA
ncbi:MAG: hypothetical protein GX620_00845 [Chloroflexi bacterium]|nr:hypothetical protein [Chloroflexota bacterium]